MDMNLSKLWEIEEHRKTWQAAVHGVAKSGRASLGEFWDLKDEQLFRQNVRQIPFQAEGTATEKGLQKVL